MKNAEMRVIDELGISIRDYSFLEYIDQTPRKLWEEESYKQATSIHPILDCNPFLTHANWGTLIDEADLEGVLDGKGWEDWRNDPETYDYVKYREFIANCE